MKLSHSAMNCHHVFKQYTKISFTEIIKKIITQLICPIIDFAYSPHNNFYNTTVSYSSHLNK